MSLYGKKYAYKHTKISLHINSLKINISMRALQYEIMV
jgi:hypothetical protein